MEETSAQSRTDLAETPVQLTLGNSLSKCRNVGMTSTQVIIPGINHKVSLGLHLQYTMVTNTVKTDGIKL